MQAVEYALLIALQYQICISCPTNECSSRTRKTGLLLQHELGMNETCTKLPPWAFGATFAIQFFTLIIFSSRVP